MEEEYTCTLTEQSLEKAQKELHEDPKNRLGAVQALREWIEQQKHLNCITSTQYLLPFLRTAKFSQLKARAIVEGHLQLRMDQPLWYEDLDPLDPQQLECLTNGIMMALPGVDTEGRKIILFREGAITKEMNAKLKKNKKYKGDLFKAFIMVLKYLIYDENVQVNGFILLEDFTGYTMAHVTTWTMDEVKDVMKWQGNYPGRYKGFYYYNTGAVFDTMLELVKPFMSKKMKDRMVILGTNLEQLYKKVPMEMLPEEYLPDDYTGPCAGSIQQITENFVNELKKPEIRDRLIYESKPEWRIDKAQKDKDAPVASFRKLNVD